MEHSPQFIDTGQDFASDGHADVVSRGLARTKPDKELKAQSNNGKKKKKNIVYRLKDPLTFLLPI